MTLSLSALLSRHLAGGASAGRVFTLAVAAVEVAFIALLVAAFAPVLLRARRERLTLRETLSASWQAFSARYGTHPLVRASMLELTMLYYATRRQPLPVPPGAQAFAHKDLAALGVVFWVIVVVSAVEVPLVHLLLHRLNATLAWTVTGLSVYSLIWVRGMLNAIALRPVVLSGDVLHVRLGCLVETTVPLGVVAGVHRGAWPLPRMTSSVVKAHRGPQATLLLRLRQPVSAQRLFGQVTSASTVALSLHDDAALVAALAARCVPVLDATVELDVLLQLADAPAVRTLVK